MGLLNIPKNRIRPIFLMLFACSLSIAFFMPKPAFTACINPVGEIADVIYNFDCKTMNFCNGDDWISMGDYEGLCPEAKTIQDVFSTDLYTGNGSTQTITNDIDLSTYGGLVWRKSRSINGTQHMMVDTARGTSPVISSNRTNAETSTSSEVTSFNSDGFSIGAGSEFTGNNSGSTYAAWTFRRAQKFFDVVTYTGDGTNDFSKTISHTLGGRPGMIMIKNLDSSEDWTIWHRSLVGKPNSGNPGFGNTDYSPVGEDRAPILNLNRTENAGYTSTDNIHYVDRNSFSVATWNGLTNDNGANYIAYLFGHDASSYGHIQCGEYTGNGSTSGPTVALGWEPQWLITKNASDTGLWAILDNERDTSNPRQNRLEANTNTAENTGIDIDFSSTGFQLKTASGAANDSGQTYIYCAIKKPDPPPPPPVADVDDVFSTDLYTGNGSTQTITNNINLSEGSGLVWGKARTIGNNNVFVDTVRGAGNRLFSDSTQQQNTSGAGLTAFNADGFDIDSNGSYNSSGEDYVTWTFRESEKFFDIVSYTGNGVSGRTIAHDLGVAPGMMIVKRLEGTENWSVYHQAVGATGELRLNQTAATSTSSQYWNNTAPTSTEFTVGTNTGINTNGGNYIAYLLAHDPDPNGYVQCGSYTGNGSASGPTINLGWEPQWVIQKSSTYANDWMIVDNERGVSGSPDPWLRPNLTNTEAAGTGWDYTFNSAGFQVTGSDAWVNANGETYVYCAIRKEGTLSASIDQTPDAYSFTGVLGASLSTQYISNSVTITGIDTPTTVSVSGVGSPEININGAGWVSSGGTINNGETLQIRMTSSGLADTAVAAFVDVGGVTDTWVVDTNTGGQQEYTSPGSHTFTVPTDVTSVSVVCVGAGGGGGGGSSSYGGVGGGGGGLGYKNNISVTPGQNITVTIGAGGSGGGGQLVGTPFGHGSAGGNSSFGTFLTATAGQGGLGGTINTSSTGGSHNGDGGGSGGGGGITTQHSGGGSPGGGGGGAGGYSGNGGAGGVSVAGNDVAGLPGSGGGAAGGGTVWRGGGGGGGVGLQGEGANGADTITVPGSANTTNGGGGGGGSGGAAGGTSGSGYGYPGGNYGGGGGGGRYNYYGDSGAGGACRIIWPGNLRQFPSTLTVDQ